MPRLAHSQSRCRKFRPPSESVQTGMFMQRVVESRDLTILGSVCIVSSSSHYRKDASLAIRSAIAPATDCRRFVQLD